MALRSDANTLSVSSVKISGRKIRKQLSIPELPLQTRHSHSTSNHARSCVMDEPWRRWSDISQEDADAESLAIKQPASIRRVRDTDLERLAKEAGTIAGQAVALVRKVRETAGRREEWKGGISDLRASAKGRLQQLRRSAEEHAEEWRRLAVE